MKPIILSLLISLSGTSSNTLAEGGNPTILRGELPAFSYKDLEAKAAQIWQFVQSNSQLTSTLPAPLIYISGFSFAEEDPEWVTWQKNWILEHPEIWDDWRANFPNETQTAETNPFPNGFYAFHYDGTNRIQINANKAFLFFYVNGPDGVKSDRTGFGYYTMGHELHHYALQARNIPGRLHHCLFLQARTGERKSLMDTLAAFLVESKISSTYILHNGLGWEHTLDPCSKLSAEELKDVEKYRQLL